MKNACRVAEMQSPFLIWKNKYLFWAIEVKNAARVQPKDLNALNTERAIFRAIYPHAKSLCP